MVKSEIISKLSQKIHRKLNKSQLDKFISIVLDTIVDGAKNDQNTQLRNFGIFSIKKIKEKKNARNPRTNEKIYVPEKKSIRFKMSKEIKNKINQDKVF